MTALLLLLVTGWNVIQHPKSPTVGDLITLRFPISARERVVIDPSSEYEIVSTAGTVATIRAFKPGLVTVQGSIAGDAPRRFRARVTIRSVLAEKDSLLPAPLEPPEPLPSTAVAPRAIAASAVAAVLAWLALWLVLNRKRTPSHQPGHSAEEEFRLEIERLRLSGCGELLWIDLADATRRYLSRVPGRLERSLTSAELLALLRDSDFREEEIETVKQILSLGDRAKFSPWGAGSGQPDDLLGRANHLASPQARAEIEGRREG